MPGPTGPVTPLPRLTDETAFFWRSGEDGVLRFLRCGDCGAWVHPPSPRCPRCLSAAVEPQPTSGRGTVHSFTVNHQPWFGDLEVPYVLAIVQLDDDPELRLTTRLVGVEAGVDNGVGVDAADGVGAGTVRIGMPVAVRFERREDVWLPLFAPTAGPGEPAG